MRSIEAKEPLIAHSKSRNLYFWIILVFMLIVGFIGGRTYDKNTSTPIAIETDVGPPSPTKLKQAVDRIQQQQQAIRNARGKDRTCGEFCASQNRPKHLFRDLVLCKDVPPHGKCTLDFCCKGAPVVRQPMPYYVCLPPTQPSPIMIYNPEGAPICGFTAGISPAQAGILIAAKPDSTYSPGGYFLEKDKKDNGQSSSGITPTDPVLPGETNDPREYVYVSIRGLPYIPFISGSPLYRRPLVRITTTTTTLPITYPLVPFDSTIYTSVTGKCRDFCKRLGFKPKNYMVTMMCANIKPNGCTKDKCCK